MGLILDTAGQEYSQTINGDDVDLFLKEYNMTRPQAEQVILLTNEDVIDIVDSNILKYKDQIEADLIEEYEEMKEAMRTERATLIRQRGKWQRLAQKRNKK